MDALENDSNNTNDTSKQQMNLLQDGCLLNLYHVLQYLKQLGIQTGNDTFDVNHMLQNWVRFNYYKEIRCGLCNEKGAAVAYCKDCDRPSFLDNLCLNFHQKINTLESHKPIHFRRDGCNFCISDFAPRKFCDNHKDTKLELYCNNCKVTFCEKCEDHKHEHNHNVLSTKHLYKLLDNVHDTKRQIEGMVQSQQNSGQNEREKLTTMITWIDVSLGIEIRYSDIKDVPVPPKINRLFDNESSANMVFIKCEAVIEKLAKIQGDLRFAFTSHQTQNALREEDHTIPKIESNDGDQHEQYGQIRLAKSHHVTRSNVHTTTPHTQIGGLTDIAARYHCHKLRQVAEDNENQANPIENEVSDLQQAVQSNVNLESYRDLHTIGSHNAQYVFLDVGGLPYRPLETGDDPWVEYARWLPTYGYIRWTHDESSSIRSLQQTENPRSSNEYTLLEMGFLINDIEKAYAVLEESGPEDITVEMLLCEILDSENNCICSRNTTNETKENPRDFGSPFASKQSRPEEEECKNKDETICKMCMENVVTTAFLPCGHLAACVKCAPALKKCPICRTVIRVT